MGGEEEKEDQHQGMMSIQPKRPPDLEMVRGILPFSSPLLDSREVKTFEESSTT